MQSSDPSDSFLLNSNFKYAIQLVKQVELGSQSDDFFRTEATSGLQEL